ncbi:MAG: endonuclease NucS domain-containing protein [Candidatus Altiarchaeota archaeon]
MDSDPLLERFLGDLGDSKTIVVVCSCSIEYWGRSRSVIGLGDRIILFKPDSTLIVHSPSGFKPVNWMSPPCDTTASVDGGRLVVFSQRTVKPFEEIRITIERVIGYHSFEALSDREKLDLTHTERDMRDWLAAHPGEVDADFTLKSVEYHSPLGFFDLYGRIGGSYAVVELKSVTAGLPAALQLKRYRDWLAEHLKQGVRGILMAPAVAPNALTLLRKEGLEFRKFNVRKLKLERRKHTLDKWIE